MKWTVQQLNSLKHKGISFDETLDLSELIEESNLGIRQLSPLEVKGEANFSGQTVTFHLTIKGEMILPCSRTLADVEFPFDIKATEVFQLGDYPIATGDDSEIHQPEGDLIDLIPYIKENILLEIPLQVFSDNEKGEAPATGNGWGVLTEEEKKNQIDPRLADLAKFFEK
ncbi:YceD family protein [Anaerobacillus sp. MEB173]|uniref:YceD family protein n=1 Tax=Anaerobacillus sp. MEB173 TaxID=3383345 RepID=UPI003F901F42